MQNSNQLPAPFPPREYRALAVFEHPPAEHGLFPVLKGDNEPHLRYGEIAVVDLSDREPQHGEPYVIEWSDVRRAITQILKGNHSGLPKAGTRPR